MIPSADSLLVVDYEPTDRDLMARQLAGQGFNVSVANSGQKALEWIDSHTVDLLLLDIEMPDIHGLDVLKEIRKTRSPAQLPVIMVSGRTGSEDVVDALAIGANDCVTKPIDFPVVFARIQNQLSRKHVEKALRESEERYALAARASNDGLWDWNLVSDKIYFSPRWKSMIGWDELEIGDSPEEWFRRIHPDDVGRVRADIRAYLEEMTAHYEGEYRILHRDGHYLWMLGRAFVVRDAAGKAHRMAGSQTDITKGKVVDVLTGLPNRVLFMDRLGRSIERARRYKDKTPALLFLDLNDFKLINDSLGHLAGDQLLVAIAERLESAVRSGDSVARFNLNNTVARLGGDEFIVLLEDIPSALEATRVAERISKILSERFVINGQEFFPRASMGIALYTPSYHTPEELLRDADIAMYIAKARGKGGFEIFDGNMRVNTIARLQLETELRRALERQEFETYYQVMVSLQTGRVWGFEALVRWQHPTRGLVLPGEFIRVVEEIGLIVPLGQTILETAARQLRIWRSRFPENPPLVSVNLSARHFLQPGLLDQCRRMLEEMQLSDCGLSLEITESAMISDPKSAIEIMNQLKSLRVKISLDDFGTGYSSLGYLHRFPLDSLKIDRSFVSRMMEDDEIVRTIITLGRNLGMKVIAEGVETTEQAARLKELGCEFAQGYYFSVPVDARQATDLLLSQHHATISGPTTMPHSKWTVQPMRSPCAADSTWPKLPSSMISRSS
jgi:diguanylate cyclase (GGDEF)-like protein/PAS domain S-box-containing protein